MSTSVTSIPLKSRCQRFLRLFLCCMSPSQPASAPIDPKAMHSIVLPSAPQQPPAAEDPFHTKAEIQWKSQEEVTRLRETLRLTLRPDAPGSSQEISLEALLRGLAEMDSRDSIRIPLSSVSSEVVSTEVIGSSTSLVPDSSRVELSRLKYKDLPSVSRVLVRPSIRSLPPVFPLKPVTPSSLTGRTRIPTARSKMGQILENLQKEESSETSV